MGVYIKGMKMPTNNEAIVITADGKASKIYGGTIAVMRGYATENSTAVELPPHGDLIDRDKYEIFGYTGTEGRPNTFDDGIMYMLERLDAAPVIVEAEGETEDGTR